MEWLGMDEPDWQSMMLTLVVSVVFLVGLISVVIMLRYRPPPRDAAARLYGKFTKATGIEREPGESPLDFAGRVAAMRSEWAKAATDITRLYLDTRYGSPGRSSLPELSAAITRFGRGNQS